MMGKLRDRFWSAFWRRQARYLPPKQVVSGCTFKIEAGGTGPSVLIAPAKQPGSLTAISYCIFESASDGDAIEMVGE